jgi:hypothetical protein
VGGVQSLASDAYFTISVLHDLQDAVGAPFTGNEMTPWQTGILHGGGGGYQVCISHSILNI